MASGFTFKLLIQCKLIFVSSGSPGCSSILAHVNSQFSQHHYWKVFSSLSILASHVKYYLSNMLGCTSGLKILSHWFVCLYTSTIGEGNGNPLQYSCLENPMDGGAWWAAVHGVAKGRTRLSDFTFIFHFHALEKEMATHSSVLAWRIPGLGEPGGLPSMGLHRVRYDWSDLTCQYYTVLIIVVLYIVQLEIIKCVASCFVLLSQDCFGIYLGSSVVPYRGFLGGSEG